MTRIRNAVISKINEQGSCKFWTDFVRIDPDDRAMCRSTTYFSDTILFDTLMKADKINDFRGQGLNVYVTFDLLKSQLHSGHWINCSFQDFEKAFQIGLASGSNSQKLAAMQENAKTPKS